MSTYSRRVKKLIRHISVRDFIAFAFGAVFVVAILTVRMIQQRLETPLSPESPHITIRWLPPTVTQWHAQIGSMAQKYKIDPNLLAIIMTMESGGDPKANSGVAQGLMQITPPTAKDIASRYVNKPVTKYNLWDPKTSIEFGAAYLAELRDIYGNTKRGPSWDTTVELIAAAYNGGFGAADSIIRGEGLHDVQTVVYSRDAFNMWRERHAADSPTFDRWKERGGSKLIEDAAKQMNSNSNL